jgi:hypothetical protein
MFMFQSTDNGNTAMINHLQRFNIPAALAGPGQVAVQSLAHGIDTVINLACWRVSINAQELWRASELISKLHLEGFLWKAMTPQMQMGFIMSELTDAGVFEEDRVGVGR